MLETVYECSKLTFSFNLSGFRICKGLLHHCEAAFLGLCWVYDPPVHLYDELSIIRLYPTLHSLSIPLVISYTHCCFTRDVFLISFRSCSGPTPVTDLFLVFLEVLGI